MSIDTPSVRLERAGAYWTARWIGPDGKRKSRGLGPVADVSPTEARRRCRRLEHELAKSPDMAGGGKAPKLGQWLDRYEKLRTDLDESTLALHRFAAAYLRRHFGDEIRIDRITRASAATFRLWLEEQTFRRGEDGPEHALSESTVRKHLSLAKQIMERAYRLDLIRYNPFDRETTSAPVLEADWRYVTDAETEQVIEACPDTAWRLRFALARWAGLRRGEIGRAQWSWIDWHEKTITVIPKLQGGRRRVTTKARTRLCPLSPRLYQALLRAYGDREQGCDESICGMPSNNVERDADVIIRRAGLVPWHKPLHTLRKSLETDWLARHPILDVVKWLGNSPEVAARHYHQSRSEVMERVSGSVAEVPESSQNTA